jgi:putative heme-binding domain-containing protein
VTRRTTSAAGACICALSLVVLAARGGDATAEQTGPLPGDVESGRVLIESSTCFDCHRIGERGSRLGPDLSDIGSRRSSDQLRQAIVAPDTDVLPQHRFVRVVTKDGTPVIGKLLNQDAFSIQLMTADERLASYLKSNLREHTILEKGLMPSYEGKLTAQKVADIVSYLRSLTGGEK